MVFKRPDFESVMTMNRFAVQATEIDSQTEIGRIALSGGAVAYARNPACLVEYGLQRGDHRLGKKRKRADEVALARAVPPDEDRRVVEVDLLERDAAEPLEGNSLDGRFHGALARDGEQHSTEQAFLFAARTGVLHVHLTWINGRLVCIDRQIKILGWGHRPVRVATEPQGGREQ